MEYWISSGERFYKNYFKKISFVTETIFIICIILCENSIYIFF